jgi:hypothetical protein
MPVSYTIKNRLFHLKCLGIYDIEELKSEFSKALNDPDFPINVAFLMDVSQSKSLDKRSAEEIKHIVEFIGFSVEKVNNRCAVLVSTDIHYGLSRMGSVFSESYGAEVKVFRDIKEALDWLMN